MQSFSFLHGLSPPLATPPYPTRIPQAVFWHEVKRNTSQSWGKGESEGYQTLTCISEKYGLSDILGIDRVVEQFRLRGTTEGHLVQPSCVGPA